MKATSYVLQAETKPLCFFTANDSIIHHCRMVTLSVLVLAATIGVCMGWGPALSFFPETTLLQCMVPNPRYGKTDQPATKVEEIPVIPFHIVYDPAVPGTWFQPLVSSV